MPADQSSSHKQSRPATPAMTAPEHPRGEASFSSPRRSATAPVMPRRSSTSSVPAQDDTVETLYSHPSVRIVAFTTSQRVSIGSSSPSGADAGTLPPSSATERTLAIGPFRIYKAPGSVAFLSCGSALQPILPKSQCWCITEDNSQFVLQIRRPQYWRIELPVEDEDDEERASLFRDILAETLQFEKTECPFKRSFTVELPEEPSTPVRTRAWTAEGKHLVSTAFTNSPVAAVSPITLVGARQATPRSDDPRDWRQFQFSTRRRRPPVVEEDEDARDDAHASPSDRPSHVGRTIDGLEVTIAEYRNWQRANEQRRTVARHRRSASERAAAPLDDDAEFSDTPTDDFYTPDERSLEEAEFDYDVERTPQGPRSGKSRIATPPHSAEKKPAAGSDDDDEAPAFEGSGYVAPVNLNKKRMSRALAGRSYTAPPHLKVATTSAKQKSAAKGKKTVSPTPLPKDRSRNSGTSSPDSFHTLPPSPPMSHGGSPDRQPFPHPHEDIVLRTLEIPPRDSSVSTLTPGAARYAPSSARGTSRSRSVSPFPRSPTEAAEQDSVAALPTSAVDGGPQVRQRLRRSNLSFSRRALSPLPPAANLFTPRRSLHDPLAAMKGLPGYILEKTLELLMSPPGHLVQLMLRVARKIIAGEWRGLVFGFNEGGEKIPVQWDYSDDESSDDDDDSSSGHSSARRRSIAHWDDDAATSRSCEVD